MSEPQKEDPIKKVLSDRYNLLKETLDNTVNIALRYEIKIRIEELETIYRTIYK